MEYVTDVNADIAKRSIKCFGTIIIRLPNVALGVCEQLKQMLVLRINYVTCAIMQVLKDVFRRHPALIENFIPFMNKAILEQLNESAGRSSFVWIVGQFGKYIHDGPYIMEKIIEEEVVTNSIELQKYLVVACTKLFFEKAPEMHKILVTLY